MISFKLEPLRLLRHFLNHSPQGSFERQRRVLLLKSPDNTTKHLKRFFSMSVITAVTLILTENEESLEPIVSLVLMWYQTPPHTHTYTKALTIQMQSTVLVKELEKSS